MTGDIPANITTGSPAAGAMKSGILSPLNPKSRGIGQPITSGLGPSVGLNPAAILTQQRAKKSQTLGKKN